MSAFLSVADGNEIVMLTDRAAYNELGVVVRIGCKVTTAATVPFAMTTRGNHVIGQKLQKRFCDAADMAGVDFALDTFAEAMPMLASDPKYGGRDIMHYHIAAWSPTRGPVRYSFHNLPEAFGDGEEPGVLNEVTGTYAAGNACTAAEYAAILPPRKPGEPVADYMFRAGPDIMEAWRRKLSTPIAGDDDGPQYVIGGGVDGTLITAIGAATETLRTWPDQVGKSIDPFAADALPEPVAA